MATTIVPLDKYTRGSFRRMLATIPGRESRRFAANHLGLDLCEEWLGAGWCVLPHGHAGQCLPVPAGYAPREVTA